MAASAEARLIVRYFGRFAPRVGDVMKSHSMTPTHVMATSADSVPSVTSRLGAQAQRSNSVSPAIDRIGSRSVPAGEKLSPYELQCFGRPFMH
ncbi:hypothetical protein BSKO_11145 [Bryopsis sp. KO-2023]|nr:hypothetical protein BSKO_11145 [Bryopsis sp. KO-2023]